jgi:gentisate 1,2-dioxygenase
MAIVKDREETLRSFHEDVRSIALEPLWVISANVNTVEPTREVQPWIWRWRDVRPRMIQAGELMGVGHEGADRRVLTMKNPSNTRELGTSRTLVSAVQMVYPGEEAPTHRHTMAALRFIIEGEGAKTIVNGEPLTMEPGDFLLTPSWTWHGHIHQGAGPMLWLDVLDVPFVRGLDLGFYEEYSDPPRVQPADRPIDDNLRRYGAGSLLPPPKAELSTPYSPLFSYKWRQARETLARLAGDDDSPYDGTAVTYTNPFTGGPVMPTINASLHLLRPGQSGNAHRHTSTTIYYVAEGRGSSILEGKRFDWEFGDTFVVPNWCWHEHTAVDGDAVLFAADDSPMLKAVDLLREQSFPDNDGHQVVTATCGV